MRELLQRLHIESTSPGGFGGEWVAGGERLDSLSPIDGRTIDSVTQVTPDDYDQIASRAQEAFLTWRGVPATGQASVR